MNTTKKDKAKEEALDATQNEEVKSQNTATDEATSSQEEATETPETEEKAEELTEEEQLKKQLAEAEEKISELNDRYLRQVAEFDNYRKRTMREKAELIKNAAEKIIVAELPVVDDMDRALENMEKSNDAEAMCEGFKLIARSFKNILKQNGLEKIETEGMDFDTDYHEAIALVPAPAEEQKGKILDCVQAGYKLNEKVIRHAKVAVGQ